MFGRRRRSELTFSSVSGLRTISHYIFQCLGAADALSLRFPVFLCFGRSRKTFSIVWAPPALWAYVFQRFWASDALALRLCSETRPASLAPPRGLRYFVGFGLGGEPLKEGNSTVDSDCIQQVSLTAVVPHKGAGGYHGCISSYNHGFICPYVQGCMGSWVHGFICSWAHGSTASWVHGFVGFVGS